ncbi:50S ribosomal protein L16 [Candidatus Woesearchaeota archaeon]|nr:50S ribosomal protein L16 [Candidatus Woesearchaeota archaeon]
MARARKAVAYRRIKRPYTRKSKYRELSYVRASPVSKVVRYDMGETKKKFPITLELISDANLQIRHNAIESARLTGNRLLEKKLGKNGFFMQLRMFPHHILRENPLASGAGADRMSTGMARSYGKAIGIAAQITQGKVLFVVGVEEKDIEIGKKALLRAQYKLPCHCRIVMRKNE